MLIFCDGVDWSLEERGEGVLSFIDRIRRALCAIARTLSNFKYLFKGSKPNQVRVGIPDMNGTVHKATFNFTNKKHVLRIYIQQLLKHIMA